MSTSYTVTEPYESLDAFFEQIKAIGWRKARADELDAETLKQGGIVIVYPMSSTVKQYICVYPDEIDGKVWISMERYSTNSIGSLCDNLDILSEHDEGFWDLPPNAANIDPDEEIDNEDDNPTTTSFYGDDQ